MRILVITPYFHPHPGGSQQYIEELYSAMQEVKPELKVDVLCYNTDHMPAEEKYRGMTIYRIDCLEVLASQFAIPNPVHLVRVLQQLKRQNQYDVVNSHTRFFDNSWWTPLVAHYFGAKSLLTDHCAEQPRHSFFLANWLTHVIDTYTVKRLARSYTQIIASSQSTQEYLKKIGVPQSTIVYPGVDVNFFTAEKNPDRSIPHTKTSLSEKEVVVAFLGRLISTKGGELFLKTVSPLLQKYPHLRIVVAGSGPLLIQLRSQYQDKKIFFTDQLNKKEVAQLLNMTDVLALPSTHHEGFPVTILLAGATRCAVVTTNQGAIGEVIQDKKNGLIIEPNSESLLDAVEQLIERPLLRKKLADQLYETVSSQFSWKKSAQIFLKILSIA